MSQNITQKTVEFTKVASRALALASKLVGEKTANDKSVADNATKVANALKTAGLIDEHEVKQATAELSNHNDALSVLFNVVREFANAKHAAVKTASSTDIGKPVGAADPTGAKVVKQSSYVGQRLGTGQYSEAEMRLIQRILPNIGI